MSASHDQQGSDKIDRVERLMAKRKWVEAEELLGSFREVSHQALECLIRMKYGLREYEALAESGELLLSCPDYELIARQPKKHAETLRYIGIGLTETRENARALFCLEESLRFDPTNQQTYLALARLFASNGEPAQARHWLERGVRVCPEPTELKMLRDVLADRPTITACMIVKDEEELLPGCLESIRDWVDEIILVDTGSTDRTVEIGREYGARIFEYEWHDDFSAARNYSLGQATSEWIMIIDADERFVLDDIPNMVDQLRAGESDLFAVNIINEYKGADRTTYSNSIRFFRRSLNLRYEGIVHNALDLPAEVGVLRTSARIRHLGYGLDENRMRQKFERTLQLLRRQLKANPDDAFALFNYAELLRGARPDITPEDAREVIKAATRVTELTGPDDPEKSHLHLMALNQLAAICFAQGELEQAEQHCRRSLELRPDYLDGLMHLGFIRYGQERYADAIEAFKKYLQVQADFDGVNEESPIILSYPSSADLAHNNLGILYELSGEPEKAKEHYQAALDLTPGFRQAAAHLGRLYLAEDNLAEAENLFRLQMDSPAGSVEALAGLGEVYFRTERYVEAINCYQQVIDTTVATSAIWNDYGNCCFKLSEYDRALDSYRRAVAIGPTAPPSIRNLGLTLSRLGRNQEAIEYFLKYLELEPADLDTMLLAGNLLVQTGSPEKAIRLFEAYLAERPEDLIAIVGLADSYHNAGQSDRALAQYRVAIRIKPDLEPVRKRIEALESAPRSS